MRLLKTLVIGMGVLLVAGLVLLAYGLYSRARHMAEPPPAAEVAPPLRGEPYQAGPVPLPPGGTVEEMDAVGNLLVVRIEDGPRHHLLTIDPRTGQVVGTTTLLERERR